MEIWKKSEVEEKDMGGDSKEAQKGKGLKLDLWRIRAWKSNEYIFAIWSEMNSLKKWTLLRCCEESGGRNE